VRRDHAHGRVADGRREHLRRPGRRAAALAHREQRADQGAHHVVAERVGHHHSDRHPGRVALPVEAAERPDGGGPFPPTAEGGEVMLAEQQRRGLVHGREVERARVPERVVPAQRVRLGWVIADPVGVPAPEGGKAGVKPRRRGCDRAYPYVGRQRPGQPPQYGGAMFFPGLRGQVGVGHLPARVHPGVGPPGNGQPNRLGQPQHVPEDPGQLPLHGPLPGLRRPPGKVRPVVGEVDSYPNHGTRRDWRGLGGRSLAHRFRPEAGSWRTTGEATGPFEMSLILNLTLRLAGT
jgi:hypothetical protein